MPSRTKFEVNWEEDDDEFEKEFSQDYENSEDDKFSELLKNDAPAAASGFDLPRVGDKVTATISHIGTSSTDVLLEIGGQTSAVIAKQDLLNESGSLDLVVGDKITAYVVSTKDGEVVLSNTMANSTAKQFALKTAYESNMPVKGKVVSLKKGGKV